MEPSAGGDTVTSFSQSTAAMKSLLIIVTGLGTSLYFTDLESESGLRSLLLPLLGFLPLCALVLWFIADHARLAGYTDRSITFDLGSHGDCRLRAAVVVTFES